MNNKVKDWSRFQSYKEYIDYLTDLQTRYKEYFQEEEFWVNIDKNIIEQLNNYIQQYPNGRYRKEAIKKIDELIQEEEKKDNLAWEKAKKENTKEAYENYLSNFPNGKYRKEAIKKIDEFIIQEEEKAWRKTRRKNTIKAYEEYLKKYPDGKYISKAKAKIDEILQEEELAWKHAKELNTKEAYEEYLKKYPDGKYISKAKAKINEILQEEEEELAWKHAKELNTKEAYEEYLKKYPNGKYVNEAIKKLNEFIWKEIPTKDLFGKELSDKYISKIKKKYKIPKDYGKLLVIDNNFLTIRNFLNLVSGLIFIIVIINSNIVQYEGINVIIFVVLIVTILVNLVANEILDNSMSFISTEGYGIIYPKYSENDSKITKFKDIVKISTETIKGDKIYHFYNKNNELIDSGKGKFYKKIEEYWKKLQYNK